MAVRERAQRKEGFELDGVRASVVGRANHVHRDLARREYEALDARHVCYVVHQRDDHVCKLRQVQLHLFELGGRSCDENFTAFGHRGTVAAIPPQLEELLLDDGHG